MGRECKILGNTDPGARLCFLYRSPQGCHSQSLSVAFFPLPSLFSLSRFLAFHPPFSSTCRLSRSLFFSPLHFSFFFFFFFTQSISFSTMPSTIFRRCIVNQQRAFSTYSHANWGTLTCAYIDTFVAFPLFDFPQRVRYCLRGCASIRELCPTRDNPPPSRTKMKPSTGTSVRRVSLC